MHWHVTTHQLAELSPLDLWERFTVEKEKVECQREDDVLWEFEAFQEKVSLYKSSVITWVLWCAHLSNHKITY